MARPEPETAEAQELQRVVTPERWGQLVEQGQARAAVVERVQEEREATGVSWRRCLAAVAADVDWSTYLHWRRRYHARGGPAWERLLDERVPPRQEPIPEDIRMAACLLRRQDRGINCSRARELLVQSYGARGDLSATSLKRLWRAAGLSFIAKEAARTPVGEEVEEFHGGAGLALLVAAAAETKLFMTLGAAVLEHGATAAEQQAGAEPRDEGDEARDEKGRFTAAYNHRWRAEHEPGEVDGRWAGDAAKRSWTDLGKLSLLGHEPATLARKLMSLAVAPLLSERRGFDGLDGPAGAWLGVLGGTAYMPATLDKALAQLGLLGADEALWDAHAKFWVTQTSAWSQGESKWVQMAIYIDATEDPYWTRHFALSGKVMRVGRVMPCLGRVAIASGAGVPLLVETHAGMPSLKKQLLPLLDRLDAALGAGGEVGRMTIVDSEAGTAGMMWALHDQADRIFITVIKGQVLKGAGLRDAGPWTTFRDQDELREVVLDLSGKGAPTGGITVRGVEMRRAGSRHPTTTMFATNAARDEFEAADIARAYLARWPNIEQLFRDSRNGPGLDRSHGYGGEYVAHVALETKLEAAERRIERATEARDRASATRNDVAAASLEPPVRKKMVALADQDIAKRERALTDLQARRSALQSLPRTIFARDTTRDGVMTCLKLSLVALIEFALREYFGGLALEWRTFIEQFVMLPVTVRRTQTRCLYQIRANPRQPTRMEQLAAAVERINAKRIRSDGQLLVFEILGAKAPGS